MRIVLLAAICLTGLILSAGSVWAGEPASGWRGNMTGLWPQANPPLKWSRIPRGAMEGLRASTTKPANGDPKDAPLVEKGLIRDWLVLGPFPVPDSNKNFDDDPLGGEPDVQPAPDMMTAGKVWTPATVPADDIMVFGTAEMPFLDLTKVFPYQRNQVGYAHTYLYSPRGGRARIVADHMEGLKAWLNGREVYRSPERQAALGYYTALSRHELRHLYQPAAGIELELKAGWNRLLLKLSTSNKEGYTEMKTCLRIMDPPDVRYESENILWMTELPNRSTATPILVGNRLYVMAEPDELVCVDKESGKVLWTAAVNYFEALTADERRAQPAYAERVDPLVSRLRGEKDFVKRIGLRAEIDKALIGIDAEKFAIHADGHFEAHFGIVGFTMPTPVSDGKFVYVWNGMGVAACFDLDGRRQWITRLETGELAYGSSPALADGVLTVFLNRLYGLDAATGTLKWTQPRIRKNVAAVLAARLGNADVFVTQAGEVIRPSDGKLLFRPREQTLNDTGWAPPVILGNTMYLPNYGVKQISRFDFDSGGTEGETWQVKPTSIVSLPDEVSRKADGGWIDRWTAGSLLVWQGLAYQTDIYGMLYVVDLESRQMVQWRQLELAGFMHYNAVPVSASVTLVGKHLVVLDNQGTALILEPGREARVVGRNQIGTVIDRWLPIPGQETLAYAPPLADGERMYLRGERYLYCIGRK